MKKTILILSLAICAATITSCKKEGCIDITANNYDKKADIDDGSCEYDDDVISEEINDDITTPTTLEAKNYKVCSSISISSELTLLPGTKLIMCEGSSITVMSNGYFNASGTAEKPIIIKGETETKGFWTGIAFKSNNPNNKLVHCQISDAGTYWAWKYATVFVSGSAQLNINNTTIANSDSYGLFIDDGGLLDNFSKNVFSKNTTGLSIPVDQVANIDGNSNYNEANVNNFIEVREGNITVPSTWPATSTPLLIEFTYISAGLTLSPGVDIQVESDGGFKVQTNGFLSSIGTVAKPISIKGRYTSAGYWEGISITSSNPNNKISHTNIEDGGAYWAYKYANIYVSGRLDITNSVIKNANSYGIYVHNSASIYTNGTLQSTASSVESENTFSGNGAGSSANCTNGCTIFFE